MSSSFRKAWFAAPVVALAATGSAWAQEVVITPGIDVAAEWDSNREMVTQNEDSSASYKATLDTTISRRTPRSNTMFRPRIVAQEFPDRKGVDPVEAFVDFRTDYRTLKGTMGLLARYARQDAIHAEFGTANFDDFDPENPQAGENGIVLVGRTRTTTQVVPSFGYALTEKTSLDGSIDYQAVDYSDDVSSFSQSYKSPEVDLGVTHEITQRSSVTVGPYYSRFETDDKVNKTDTTGVSASWSYKWSEVTYTTITLRGERNEVEDTRLVDPTETSTNWGLDFQGVRQLRLGTFRYSVGRFLSPSTLGSRRQSDQLRLQYGRPLTPRVDFTSALRLVRDTRLGSDPFSDGTDDGDDTRKRARAEMNVRWALSRTMYVAAGYQYWWQDFGGDNDTAQSHAVILSFGYRAFTPTR